METSERLAVIEEKLDNAIETLNAVNYAINGNGQPGFKVRLDRLEQQQSRNTKWTFAIGMAAISSVLTIVVKAITG